MPQGLILTLGGIESWIVVALLLAPAIAGWIKKTKKEQAEKRQQDEGGAPLELEQMAARRREQLRQASQQRAQADISGGTTGGMSGGASGGTSGGGAGPGNMSMAERIARARAKAQYEQRGEPSGRQAQPQVPNEAQRRALEQRQAELERRREAVAQQQRAQKQQQSLAQQRAQQRAQQQSRAQQAQAHSRAQARARQQGRLIHETVAVPEPTSSVPRRLVPSKPTPQPEAAAQRGLIEEPGDIAAGKLTRNDLRRAIIMNEVLGKPLALRENGGW